jgi:hypothetical protein
MSTTDDLIPLLKKLRLSGVLQSLELRTRQAADDDLSHGEFQCAVRSARCPRVSGEPSLRLLGGRHGLRDRGRARAHHSVAEAR